MELTKEEKVQKVINQIVLQLAICENKVQVNPGTKPGDNWIGHCYRILITGYNTIREEIRLALYAKIAPSSLEYRTFCNTAHLYEREVYFYKKIIPELMLLQIEKSVTEPFEPFPKQYLTSTEYFQEFVLMEDMGERGYVTGNHRQAVNYESALIVIKTLGKLHALSFALKINKPKVYQEIKSNLKENFFSHPDMSRFILEIVLNLCNQLLSNCASDPSTKEPVQKLIEKLPIFLSKIALPEEAGKYDVICHGDPQLRNIMFKYKEGFESQVPEDCCLIDMQIARVCSPALDLLFFLFLSTDKDFRRLHYKNILEEYYNSFSTFLKELGGNPKEALPFNVLQDHLKKFAPFGLLVGIWLIGINFKSADECIANDGVSTNSLRENFCRVNNNYFIRVKDLILDMMEYGYAFDY